MKLALFSPVVVGSAIAGVSCQIVWALRASGHDVVVIRSDNSHHHREPIRDFGVPVLRWGDTADVRDALNDCDAAIYQIGNYYGFHEGCLEWLPEFPGIVCLHDFFVGELFLAWAHAQRKPITTFVGSWYGDEIAQQYADWSNNGHFVALTSDTAPMTEWICAMANGVITHSTWGLDRVMRSCAGPVGVTTLCHNKTVKRVAEAAAPTGGKFKILTIGHMNANKRMRSVIQAIGGSETLRGNVVYRLAGAIEAHVRSELEEMSAALNVELEILGAVDDEMLQQQIDEADTISCLRWPALEAASGSLVEALLNGKATVVTNVAFYSEIPNDCVIKIEPANEVEEVRAALEKLLTDGAFRTQLAATGNRWAIDRCTPEIYAEKLIELVSATRTASPVLAALSDLGETLVSWGASEQIMGCEEMTAPLRIFQHR